MRVTRVTANEIYMTEIMDQINRIEMDKIMGDMRQPKPSSFETVTIPKDDLDRLKGRVNLLEIENDELLDENALIMRQVTALYEKALNRGMNQYDLLVGLEEIIRSHRFRNR